MYLPPNLPGSTPKKPNLIPSQAREGNPELEDMNHQELVDLVKELLQERANRSTNPSKDIPLAGHVTTNHEKCAPFGTRLEQKLNQVTLQYPDKISDTMYWNCVRERFFHCLSKNPRTNLRPQFDGGVNYYKLLALARMIESENFHEDAKTEAKPANQKDKAKVGAVTIDNTAQQIQQLQGAVKGLTKLIQGSRQNTQPQQIPQFVPQLVQDDPNTLPQASQIQNPAHLQGGRGSRGGFRGRGRGRGGLILCYWCRDFLPKEQANHKMANCPYQNQARDVWWKRHLDNGATLPTRTVPSPVGNLSGNTQQEDQENC